MPQSRKTIQKAHLESTLESIKGFFTAEDIYTNIKNKNIGIATIYRFLKDKTKKHELHSYVCDERTIYSCSSNSHSHYTCQVCGKKEHITIQDIGSIKKHIKGTICHFQIDVTGVCGECEKKL